MKADVKCKKCGKYPDIDCDYSPEYFGIPESDTYRIECCGQEVHEFSIIECNKEWRELNEGSFRY